VSIVILNWVAPSTINAELLSSQASCLAHIVNSNIKNMAAILMPMHCYKRGGLWLQEQASFFLLMGSCLVDKHLPN
jgi:hypothetical protein